MTPTEAEAITAYVRERTPTMPALLASVRARPGMWLGGVTIAGLHLFLDGLGYAETLHGIPVDARLGGFDFVAFEAWVAARFNPERMSVGSYWLAADRAGSDAAGFALWFAWYDQFNADAARR